MLTTWDRKSQQGPSFEDLLKQDLVWVGWKEILMSIAWTCYRERDCTSWKERQPMIQLQKEAGCRNMHSNIINIHKYIHKSQDCARLRPGARSSICASLTACRDPGIWCTWVGSRSRTGGLTWCLALIRAASVLHSAFICCTTTATLC